MCVCCRHVAKAERKQRPCQRCRGLGSNLERFGGNQIRPARRCSLNISWRWFTQETSCSGWPRRGTDDLRGLVQWSWFCFPSWLRSLTEKHSGAFNQWLAADFQKCFRRSVRQDAKSATIFLSFRNKIVNKMLNSPIDLLWGDFFGRTQEKVLANFRLLFRFVRSWKSYKNFLPDIGWSSEYISGLLLVLEVQFGVLIITLVAWWNSGLHCGFWVKGFGSKWSQDQEVDWNRLIWINQ